MKDSVLTKEFGNYRVNITYCTEYDNPRTDWDCNAAHFVTRHRRYSLTESSDIEGEINALAEKYRISIKGKSFLGAINALNAYCVIKPIAMYEHSGITVWFGSPNDRWDSGYIGYGYITEDDVNACGRNEKDYPTWRDQAEAIMNDEMDTFDRYCRGEVYDMEVEKLIEPTWAEQDREDFDMDEWREDDAHWEGYDACCNYIMDAEELADLIIKEYTPKEPEKPKFIPKQLRLEFA